MVNHQHLTDKSSIIAKQAEVIVQDDLGLNMIEEAVKVSKEMIVQRLTAINNNKDKIEQAQA